MQRFHKILVGVDLSSADRLAASELNPPTVEAVRRALWLAEHLSSSLTFFSALDVSARTRELLQDRFEQATRTVEDEANRVLAELVDRAKQQGIAAEGKFVFGKSWVEIIRQVLREQHDLVITGTRDIGAPGRLLFDSTGMKLLRYCPCPVWVTKPDPDWNTMNVLVSSDLSEVSQDALNMAVNSGQLVDAKIQLVHSIEHHLDRRIWHTGLSEEEIQAFREKTRADAEHQLHQHLSQTGHRTLKQGVELHVAEGPAEVVILEAIDEYQIDCW